MLGLGRLVGGSLRVLNASARLGVVSQSQGALLVRSFGTRSTGATNASRGHLIRRWQPRRPKSDITKGSDKGGNKQLASEKPFAQLTPAEKVVETGKDAGSVSVIAIGVGLSFVFLMSIGKQLLFKETPRTVYADTLKKVQKNEELEDALGSIEGGSVSAGFNPFKTTEYIAGDNNYLRMQFDIKGSKGKGTVHLEMKKPTSLIGSTIKSYRYRYLFVDYTDFMSQQPKRLIIEDNRAEDH